MMYLDGSNGKLYAIKRIKKQTIKKVRKPKDLIAKNVGDIVQFDTVTIQVAKEKTYFINAIDLASRKAFSFPAKKLNSYNAMLALQEFEKVLKVEIKAIQTDNGLEHCKYFDEFTKNTNKKHYWNRPATPKSNCYIEPYNRTMQEDYVNHILHLLNSLTPAELKALTNQYLIFYNNIRPHKSLQYQTPQSVYNKLMSFSHM